MTSFRRKIFYLSGFEPRGARYYHGVYREAAARWAAQRGTALAVSERRRASPVSIDWTIDNAADGAATSYTFLRWEDIVRRAWITRPVELGRRVARAYVGLLRHIDWRLVRAVPSGPVKTLFYPPTFAVALPLLIGLAAFLALLILLPWWAALPLGAAAGVAGAVPLLAKLHVPWLLRFFVFNAETVGGTADPTLNLRLDAFADLILAELEPGTPWDEILLIAHSNGTILTVPLMDRLLAARGGVMPGRFALVTLGQSIPLILCRRDAVAFRERLRSVARGVFRWFDIGSPADGAGFFGVNPMTLIGAETRPVLVQLNPRFYRFWRPENYNPGLSGKYQLHTDYLRVGDDPSPLDYPSLTATARPIAAAVAAFQAID